MKRPVDNAFTRSRPTNGDRRTSAALHAAIEAFDSEHATTYMDGGSGEEAIRVWALTMSPMRLVDAVPALLRAGMDEGGQTLMTRVRFAGDDRTAPASVAAWVREELHGSLAPQGPASAEGASGQVPAEIVADHGVLIVAESAVVLGDEALRRLLDSRRLAGVTLVRVAGPIERADGRAILAALDAGHPARDGDFRATHTLRVDEDRTVMLETDSHDLALAVVAENLRQYLAAVLDREVETIEPPHVEQIHGLLSISGTISVRPIETDCFATFIDVGVGTSPDGDEPAAHSLIFDLPSGTWHAER
ncbi:MAG TPA: hypothetical protein PKC43_08745 [Phycisphaerales bacterium]|nr:hypothetical protein [Phycisphaerales bacterium]HMP37523.1 hypothetical protein [Phycisphaerales bacterium]